MQKRIKGGNRRTKNMSEQQEEEVRADEVPAVEAPAPVPAPLEEAPVTEEPEAPAIEKNVIVQQVLGEGVAGENSTEPSAEQDEMSVEEEQQPVDEARPEPERETLTEPTLHISGLPVTVKATELAPILEAFGEVTKIVILPPKTIYQAFGFVSYSNKEDAEKCLENLNDRKYQFDNQYTWKVNWAKQGPLKSRNVGPSGRPYTFTDNSRKRGRGGFRGGRRGGYRGGYAPY